MQRPYPLVLCCVALSLASANARGAPSPDQFGRLPAVSSASLSPDGEHVVTVGGAGSQRLISIAKIDSDELVSVPLGGFSEGFAFWASDNFILVRVSYSDRSNEINTKYHIASEEDVYEKTRTLIFDSKGKFISYLMKGNVSSSFQYGIPILGISSSPKTTAYLQGRTTVQTGWRPAVWAVDVRTDGAGIIEEGNDNTLSFMVGAEGEAHLRIDSIPNTSHVVRYVRPKGQSGWRALAQEPDEHIAIGYSDPEDAAYFVYQEQNGDRLVKRSLSTGEESAFAEAGKLEALSMTFTLNANPWSVYRYAGASSYTYLNPKVQLIAEKLARALPGRQLYIEPNENKFGRYLVHAQSSESPSAFYIYDDGAQKLSLISYTHPDLADTKLGSVKYYTYHARDGLEIPAYLTLPPGVENPRGLPLVVFPHSLYTRDDFVFDYWAQYMAALGFAVVQPQVRGTNGFGRPLYDAGKREWNGKIQEDYIDAIRDLSAKNIIDEKRVCIVGKEYAGFGAMSGVIFHPEIYKCGIAVNGISDFVSYKDEYERRSGASSFSTYFKTWIGDPVADKQKLHDTSPLKNVSALSRPLLLIVSPSDHGVLPEQSEQMVSEGVRLGKTVKLTKLSPLDQNLDTAEGRVAMLAAVGAFLQENLP